MLWIRLELENGPLVRQGPMGNGDGRSEIERGTEINVPYAAESPRLGLASLVEERVWNVNLEVTQP